MARFPRLFLGATGLLVCFSAVSEGQTIDLDTVLTRATRYVGEFVHRFTNVVAEETYLQETIVSRSSLIRGAGAMQGLTTGGSRRNLKSDFLLVRLPESTDYLPFRDVFEVDGASVRDREQRLTSLFLESKAGAVEQARKIRLESARYNLGNLSRTFNNPIIALALLQASARPRFRYSLERQDRTAGANVWIVAYREQTRPTVIKGQRGRDIFARGQFWIDADTGRVLRSELELNDPGTADWFEAYAPGAANDPRGPAAGELRSIRGGSWGAAGAALRCAARTGAAPSLRDARIGVRVAADRAGITP